MSISFLAEWEPDPLWRAEVYLAVFQVFMTGRGRIFSKEDVGKVANANGGWGVCFGKGRAEFVLVSRGILIYYF